ncbi:YjgH family protein [Aspergillus ibericus CBS 121593]|uniref:YjgF-like protein n=1 Tax=Aspergillus ibericus CBS 121593 TaxID=1448316 RepID=A0A395H9D9_9EURO|nr:YjgF-like protein [Aspergillus ibericus CBS 121593]RAL04123.1 YjgF-like protein [Aspergillus ibericus CBS 121593]
MPTKHYHTTPSPYEHQIGYYRAIRHTNHIYISGTTAVNPSSPPTSPQILFPNDAKNQTITALTECITAIRALGGTGAENIIRVRMFVARREDCGAVGEGFREVLGRDKGEGVGAVATMIVVPGGFVNEGMLVEVEVDGVVDD